MTPVLERIETLLREITRNPQLAIGPETDAHDVQGWDSLVHVMLLAGLEESFGITFALSEVRALRNVGQLASLVDAKRAAKK